MPLFVPVRQGRFSASLRLFRTVAGRKTAVGFTSPLRLAKALGSGQQWVRLSEPALRGMLKDLDVIGVVVDPAGTITRPSTGAA
ncbi:MULTISPECIES: SAV_915 family protein [Nonomuraea]|uniref:SAV_915 family protein n=1 Tax=Nonomuraea mangrovi TaxID=2316207 RepID=A0ABW4T549_9ACTN